MQRPRLFTFYITQMSNKNNRFSTLTFPYLLAYASANRELFQLFVCIEYASLYLCLLGKQNVLSVRATAK